MTNPLLEPWAGPYGGVPPFDRARVEHLKPALEAGMAAALDEIDRIANDPAAPTFEYRDDPELTASVHKGRAFTLGDVGYLDEGGGTMGWDYLLLTARRA